MSSGTCPHCHGEGCQKCYQSGWCAPCGGCGMICSYCKSPTVRLRGGCSLCYACDSERSTCAKCAKAARVDCPACSAGDIEAEALRIAAAAPPTVMSDEFYRELTAHIEQFKEDVARRRGV